MFLIGAALNMDVNSNNMLIFAAELENGSIKDSKPGPDNQFEISWLTLPTFRIALESDINSWLTTRVGAYKMMTKYTVKNDAGDETSATGPNNEVFFPQDYNFFLGAGFHLGEWDIDANINPEMPFRLGYWLTGFGVQDPDPPIYRVSGVYRY